ncbi:EthD family reductase [Nocardia sp. NPDC004123]
MYKFVVLYFTPKDPEHFKKHYEEIHVPLGASPRIKKRWYTFDVHSLDTQVQETASNVFCYYEALFESEAEFNEFMNDPAGKAAAQDTENFATGGLLALYFSQQ